MTRSTGSVELKIDEWLLQAQTTRLMCELLCKLAAFESLEIMLAS